LGNIFDKHILRATGQIDHSLFADEGKAVVVDRERRFKRRARFGYGRQCNGSQHSRIWTL